MTRFFVPNKGVTHQWTVKEMASHDDFVYLDMSATYQTIGSQMVRPVISVCKSASNRWTRSRVLSSRAGYL